MSIFNLQSLEEKASSKKVELQENKQKKTDIVSERNITEDYIFCMIIREMEDISNKVNANIAYKESLPEDTSNTNSALFKDIISEYMRIFTDINQTLREKCLAIKQSIDILKERLDKIDDPENKNTLSFITNCTYINLGYLRGASRVKALIDGELSGVDRGIDNFEPINDFRSNIRQEIINTDDIMDKHQYIQKLYELFRSFSKTGITLNKSFLLDKILLTYQFPVLYGNDINSIYTYLDNLYKSDTVVNDIIAKRIETILQEYAFLYSARADAIVEFSDKIRDYLSLYIESFGGEDDE